jgi:nicotinate-nucleotide pyrophosphorylase (carboxylating)
MNRDFQQIEWGPLLEEDWRHLLTLAIREDLDRLYDWTTVSLIPEGAIGRAEIVARQHGVVAGLPAARMALSEFDRSAYWTELTSEGSRVVPAQPLVRIEASARNLLTAERTILNVLGRLSGIATLTRRFVDAVAGSRARIYDTRKTTAAWRRLEKYAVRMGGGFNHRLGLYDAILIKDNHLALGKALAGTASYTPADAVVRVREFLSHFRDENPRTWPAMPLLEVEVDSLEQLVQVLPTKPDIVLLDNMPPAALRRAVALRDQHAPDVQLEASGGVDIETVGAIAASGVDRISVGALTHSAPALDVALDWLPGE